MNMECCLILELLLYEFKLDDNTAEVSKNICAAKDESVVDHAAVARWLQKFHSGWKNFDNQAR